MAAIALGCVALVPHPARAQAGQLVPSSTGVQDPAVLSLRDMRIDVGIARGYARVNVRQIFENHTTQIQEGTYRFQLPPSAAVGDFAVWDGLVRIPGVILEKQRARAIYRELTQQRIDPGLLQQGEEEEEGEEGEGGTPPSSGALFSVTVAPIPPLATKRLEIQFQQEVPLIHSVGELSIALRPADGEPPVARSLAIHVKIEDGDAVAVEDALPLTGSGGELSFQGTDVTLDRDLVVRFAPKSSDPVLLHAFRNPSGSFPDGISLAPWENVADIPPDKDGFFLLEMIPPDLEKPAAAQSAAPAAAPPLSLVVLFDTSLSQRFAGIETAYGHLVTALDKLRDVDRFAVVAFDASPDEAAALAAKTSASVSAALARLKDRPLAPGTDVPAALAAARRLLPDGGRILLLTDGVGDAKGAELRSAAGETLVFTAITGQDVSEALRGLSAAILEPTATSIESDLFFERLIDQTKTEPEAAVDAPADEVPFQVSGGDARLPDVYPGMVQPPVAGSLSGWIGRYGTPQPAFEVTVKSPLLPGESVTVKGSLPDVALEARDLPRRWARARVDHLLALIDAEGEKREWIDEIIALSKRYKFVTPYTAFLAAPRSLLRPRVIQPGDPVIRVQCDAGTTSVTALFPFGLELPLSRRPGTDLWEGRFLVPGGLKDGPSSVRMVLRTATGQVVTETKSFVIDGTPPRIFPDAPAELRAGTDVPIAVRADRDAVFLSARLGESAPVPLRWDPKTRRCLGTLRVPGGAVGEQEIVFEAVDAAHNHGFARATVEVLP
ncbi:MAG: VIT domain-containing protein [Acidobacteriota bacterium]